MSVLVYLETQEGQFKKSALEAASYAAALAAKMNTQSIAIVFEAIDSLQLGAYGIHQVLQCDQSEFNALVFASTIADAVTQTDAKVIVLASTSNSKYAGSILASKLEAAYIPNVVELPESTDPIIVKRSVFSNKGFAKTKANAPICVIAIAPNSYGVHENKVEISLESFKLSTIQANTSSLSIEKTSNKISIADADVVVSAGRGLKGPENWGMIEELADVLGAATACSKPVSDMGWRPHSEHVGQTGKPVACELYIAIGISGAIQHLAGVSSSKVKLVINNDPEAPFFKSADYGVVGDAFNVVPKLIEKLKSFKG